MISEKCTIGWLERGRTVVYEELLSKGPDSEAQIPTCFQVAGTFLVKLFKPTDFNVAILSSDILVDNLSDTEFILAYSHKMSCKTMVVKKGYTPAINSMAEVLKNYTWMHIADGQWRRDILTQADILYARDGIEKVYLWCNTSPIKLLYIPRSGDVEELYRKWRLNRFGVET